MTTKRSIYFIEGLPGCGKTTISSWLHEKLGGTLLLEGMPNNPNNFFEIAGIPGEAYSEIRYGHPAISDFTEQYDAYKYVNIGEVKKYFPNNKELIGLLSEWDLGDEYNANINSAYFKSCTLPRINAWVKSIETWEDPIIMDSMWLQNPINEMLYRNADADSIEEYCSLITESFSDYRLICIYLKHRNASEAIKFASQVKGELWTSRVVDAICRTPYGIVNNLQGMDGLMQFFSNRAEIEERILSRSLMTHYEYSIDDYSWDEMRDKLTRMIFEGPSG